MNRSSFRNCFFLGILAITVTAAQACSVTHIADGAELAASADLVVRAIAVEYKSPPANPDLWTTGIADSIVSFQVLETIHGVAPSSLTLHGYLAQRDDFNDQAPPYTFVRPGGRAGSCFANTYRQGAEYLLFLKKSSTSGELTVDWSPLAPVNEQLHDGRDPWLLWVRARHGN